MHIEGDYRQHGYALVRELVPREVTRAFMGVVRKRLLPGGVVPAVPVAVPVSPILSRNIFEVYGHDFPPMKTFLWGLTPAMEEITGSKLIPTYNYFRIYREGDVCRVHRDRPACEHSLSLTLDYSDDAPWPLELGTAGLEGGEEPVADDFGEEPKASLSMSIGDAVAYRGTDHRHGRTIPNPNMWSAHLFLHWVDRDGPHSDRAFDGTGIPEPVNFTFA